MVGKLLKKGQTLLTKPQSSVFSAAVVIMVMIVASKILGFIRQRTLFSYFPPDVTDTFLASFELPDLIFEVFIYGVLSAAFIPVFSKYISKGKEDEGWYFANSVLSILIGVYAFLAALVFVLAPAFYTLLAGDLVKGALGIGGGFTATQIAEIVSLTRVLLLGQLFFVASNLITGALEAHRRFIVPAIAPLFYNLGIILGTVFLAEEIGLFGPALGALAGAFLHLIIQLPFVFKIGFKFRFVWDTKNKGVKELVRLSLPRVVELLFFQLRRFVWLFLASLVPGGFTYLKSADLLQALPVGVFGLSLAKAAFPTLSQEWARRKIASYRNSFYKTLNQIMFFVVPSSVFLAVLRIPVVRLVFGAQQFDWAATVQTGYVLSSFTVGTFAYAGSLLISRGFYALHDTRTPVAISVSAALLNTLLGFFLVLGLRLNTWGIALSYSLAGILQFVILTALLLKRVKGRLRRIFIPFARIAAASLVSGSLMFMLLKIFDRSVWVKRLSFLGTIEVTRYLPFEKFVLDTRYTGNLLLLTISVTAIGSFLYVFLLTLMRADEIWVFANMVKRAVVKYRLFIFPGKAKEQVAPPPIDTETS